MLHKQAKAEYFSLAMHSMYVQPVIQFGVILTVNKSNNPIGGLGLTSGILDAFVYGNALTRVCRYGEPASILTDCAESRRNAWLNATSKFALGNLHRLADQEGEQAEARKEFFDKLNNDKNFPGEFRKHLDKMIPETFEMETKATDLVEKIVPESFETPKTVGVAG